MNGQDVYVQSDKRCFLPTSGTEFWAYCSVPDRCNALPQVVGCCAVSAPKQWMSLSEGGKGVSQPFLGGPVYLPETREDCVHLTQSPLISALAPFSSSSHLPASPMLFEDDGSIGHVPPAKKCKARRCTNMSISKSYTMQLDSADTRKTSNSFSSLGHQREATPCHTGTVTPGTGADTSLLACSGSYLFAQLLMMERSPGWCPELDCGTSPHKPLGLVDMWGQRIKGSFGNFAYETKWRNDSCEDWSV